VRLRVPPKRGAAPYFCCFYYCCCKRCSLQLAIPRPPFRDFFFPPGRITVVDRGPSPHAQDGSGLRQRGFANLPGMLAVLRKYPDLVNSIEVVTDETLMVMSFEQQAALFANTGLLIMAHGAGLSNAVFLPQVRASRSPR
jgi:hypothetical protein